MRRRLHDRELLARIRALLRRGMAVAPHHRTGRSVPAAQATVRHVDDARGIRFRRVILI
jgi:DNA-binding response OmpR family regulator